MEAYKKYQPFKDPVPLDDIVQMIRAQANVRVQYCFYFKM